ncbi:MAG: hypothetical protein UW09_C0001G0003 [candidate division TM6 bacterium GW2011_GWF2_43_87]|nr:MAG: hypothetical protein UW09_C0001G0003 [candidate division TM6 bacterium GW2011_GWF2_43_87]
MTKIHFHRFFTFFLLLTPLYHPLKAMNENSQEQKAISPKKITENFFVKCLMKGDAEENTLFHKAAQTGDITLLTLCKTWELNPNKRNSLGESPLDNAIQKGYRFIIRSLVEIGATVDTKAISLAKDDDIKEYLKDHTQKLALTPPEKEWDEDKEKALSFAEKRLVDLKINTKDENGSTVLHAFAENGNIKELIDFAKVMDIVDIKNNLSETPLDIIYNKGLFDTIRNETDDNGNTLLHFIAQRKHFKTLWHFAKVMDINIKNKDGETPLHIIMKRVSPDTIRCIDTGRTIFHTLAKRGDINSLIDCAKVMDINIKNNLGETPLHVLMKNRSLKKVKKFIKAGVRPDSDALELAQNLDMYRLLKRGQDDYDKKAANKAADADDSPLVHQDIDQLSFEFFKETITKKDIDEKTKYNQLKDALTKTIVDINTIVDEYGHSILYFAIEGDYSTIVTLLIENGADIHGSNLEKTPLQHALDLIKRHKNPSVAKVLLKKGADINGRNSSGWAPCHYAVGTLKDESSLKFLIKNGAAINKKTIQHECTPLHMAMANDLSLIKILVDNGANLNEKNNKGNTALHILNDHHIADFLIKSGADINLKNNEGETPLHLAIKKSLTNIAKNLINHDADINAETLAGVTITKLVQKKQDWDLVIPLIKRGATFENWDFSSTPKKLGNLIKTVINFHLLAQQKLSLKAFTTKYFDNNEGDILGYLLPYGNKKTTQSVRKWCDKHDKFIPHYKVIYANKSPSTTSQKTPILAYGKLYEQKVKNGF